MSFVGSRPEVTKYVKKYTKEMRATLLFDVMTFATIQATEHCGIILEAEIWKCM